MAINKIIYGRKVLIDLTSDTVSATTLLKGKTAHLKNGKKITGTLFADHPDSYEVLDTITSSTGTTINSESGSSINGRTVYVKV